MSAPSLDLRKASRWLRARGYRFGFHEAGFCACLLEYDNERWLGRGRTRRSAFRHALALAFPSHAAREMLAETIAAWEETVAAPIVERALAPVVTALSDTVLISRASILPPRHDSTPSRRVVPSMPMPAVLAAFDDLEESVRSSLATASLLPDRRQRLLLLSWVAHARHLEEAAAGVREARERGRRLTDWARRLSKIWWPGTLRALDPQAAPADSSLDLPIDSTAILENWEDVAAAAEDSLARMESDDTTRGFDGDGWSDGKSLDPAPSDAEGMLREAAAHIVATTTKLLRASESREGASWLVEWTKHPVLQGHPPIGWTELASRVRWLRGHASDSELWGAAIGRLRCIAERLPAIERDDVNRILHPQFEPVRSWAHRLGLDPERKALQRRRRELLSSAPELAWDDVRITLWIRDAIELKELMTSERIAVALVSVRERVKSFGPEIVSGFGRRYKRRLRDIQVALDQTPFSLRDASRLLDPATDVEGVEDESRAVIATEQLEIVLGHTRGKSALIVSNRNDPEQDREIQNLLLLASVDHGRIEPRRVESLSERVEQGRYDFVLAATGFMPHKVDGVLRTACVRAGIPYVRMNRGRPRSCLSHVARELGLSQRAR